MATYKVLQDIEAEDKLLGPLTARQCIYAAIGVVSCYLSYLVAANGAAFLIVFLLPFIGFGFFFAFPWTKQQSTEVWALARVRFALKPRRRIWDQNGTKNIVTVTAPVQVETRRTNLSEREVVSRLQALANTIDSRGWAVKNVPVSMYSSPNHISASDRLLAGDGGLMGTPGPGSYDSTDIFDEAANPLAGELEAKMAAAANNKRQQLVTSLDAPVSTSPPPLTGQPQPISPAGAWYTQQPQTQTTAAPIATADSGTAEETFIVQRTTQPTQQFQSPQQPAPMVQQSYADIRTPQPPIAPVAQAAPAPAAPAVPVTPQVNPAILELANNNDLNIATIAREAKQINSTAPHGTLGSLGTDQAGQGGEVSVSLR